MDDTKGRGAGPDHAWRRWTWRTLTIFCATIVLSLAAILYIDPYDSGRFPALGIHGESYFFQRYGNIGLARAARFNAAIFGNSHGQILNPRTISRETGLKFVQLTIPGTNPREQIAMMHWFVSHHERPEAVVFALDERWCNNDPALPVTTYFPFGLYRGNFEYVANMVSTRALRDAYERVMFALGHRPSADPDGYDSYEAGKVRDFRAEPPALPPEALMPPKRDGEPRLYYPALALLDGVIDRLPPETRILIVLPPQFATRVSSNADEGMNDCKRAMAKRLRGRVGSGMVDYLVQSPITRDPANFWDDEHYTSEIGKLIERDIADVLNTAKKK